MITIEHEAVVRGRALPISPKMSVALCKEIKGKNLQKAKKILEEVIALKKPLPFKRFNQDLAHKPGMAAARYPVKSSQYILGLLHSLEKNAENKGLDTQNLKITSALANIAQKRWHTGRQRRTKIKSAHLEIKVIEQKEIKNDRKTNSSTKT